MKKSNVIPPSTIPRFSMELGSGFLLLFAFIYFFDENGLLAALFPAVLVHEFGHIFAMLIFGAYPSRLKATLAGFSLDYSGDITDKQEMIIALAGPILGFLFSLLCARLGRSLDSEYLLLCAGLSFVLNIFNLLPAMSLDGGRVLNYLLSVAFGSRKAMCIIRTVGLLTVFLLLLFGLYYIANGYGFSLFIAGIWLFVLQKNKSCK